MLPKLQQRLLQQTPKPERPPSKAEKTREAILAAALDFFWQQSFHDLTVGELMARTGHSRSTYYLYFHDLYELMETLLSGVEAAILEAATPWFRGDGDPLPLLEESLEGLVRVSCELGPVLRAVADAQAGDDRLAQCWADFLATFDDAVVTNIEHQQQEGWIPSFDARPVAIALNRMDAYVLIHAFGRRPQSEPEPVLNALVRVWRSTLYGTGQQEHVKTSSSSSSSTVRTDPFSK